MNFTTQIALSASWQEVASGPTSGTFEIDTTQDAYWFIATEAPSDTLRGHNLNPNETPTIQLEDGESLYIRADDAIGVAIITHTNGNTIYGTDKRVYSGLQAFTTQAFTEANCKNGTQFYFEHEFTAIPIAASRYIAFTTGTNFFTLVKERRVATNGDNVLYSVFRNPSLSGCTAVTVQNFNDVDPATTQTAVVHTPTVTNDGTLWDRVPIYGSVGVGNRVSGSLGVQGIERVLNKNETYLVKITNRSTTDPVSVHIFVTWYEGELSIEALP